MTLFHSPTGNIAPSAYICQYRLLTNIKNVKMKRKFIISISSYILISITYSAIISDKQLQNCLVSSHMCTCIPCIPIKIICFACRACNFIVVVCIHINCNVTKKYVMMCKLLVYGFFFCRQ